MINIKSTNTPASQMTVNYRVVFLRIACLLFLSFGIFPFFIKVFEPVRTPFYFVPMVFISAICGFLSIPFLTGYLYSKSVTMNDLIDHTQVEEEKKETYKRTHKYLIYILSGILVGIFAYYFGFKVEVSALNWIEIAGMMRGFISYYFDIQHTGSKILKNMLHIHKQRVIRKRINQIEFTTREVIGKEQKALVMTPEIRPQLSSPKHVAELDSIGLQI
jgi:hypothetical protein